VGADRAGKEDTGMSQEEVLGWPEANPGWHRTGDIATGLGFRHSRVLVLLSRVFRYKGVNRRKSADGRGWEWSI
jgi:DNA-binding CsgD family transcriptional regulator